MSSLPHRALGALGISVIYLLAFIYPLIDPAHAFLYHLHGSPAHVFVPVLLDILIASLLFFALLSLAARSPRFGPAIALSLLISLPWILYRGGAASADWYFPLPVSILFVSATILSCLALFFIPSTSARLLNAAQLARTIFTFCGLSGLLVLAQLVYFGIMARAIEQAPVLHHAALASTPRPRVIWILLDELSFDQVYEHRSPGLRLPAFDALALQSTLFTHTVPAGTMTEWALPALITGLPAAEIRTSATGDLLALRDPHTQLWRPFNPAQTVFADALHYGYSTSLVGWYNPYCRILPAVLDHCLWRFTPERAFYMHARSSILRNTLRPLFLLLDVVHYLRHGTPRFDRERKDHLRDFQELNQASTDALADPSATMLLIHMPVPHPPAFFDRRTGVFSTTGGSYLDSLALADAWLAQLKGRLDRQNDGWNTSTVVVMGDHSWRTALIWGHSPFWTTEDQRASHNLRFDDRPAYLVKLPGQALPNRIEQTFQATRTRALFNQIFAGSIKTPVDLATWAASGN